MSQREAAARTQAPAPVSVIGTGVATDERTQPVSIWQNIDEPFGNTPPRSQEGIRVSQTPAPPSTRPRNQSPQSPRSLESVLPDRESNRWSNDDLDLELPGLPESESNSVRQPVARPISSVRNSRSYLQNTQDDDALKREQELMLYRRRSKSCGDYRAELLGQKIEDIALDVSPPPNVKNLPPKKIYRQWTDTSGQILASGTLTDIRRGYVIIDAGGELLKISMARLGESDLAAVAAAWEIPDECIVVSGLFTPRCWEPQTVTWYASNLCHKPLYFEHVQLERYGHSAGPIRGPLRATAHFFGSVLFFPYHTAINPPNECQYALGYYRPGNCAPWLVDPFPISLRGAVRQGAVVTAGFYLF